MRLRYGVFLALILMGLACGRGGPPRGSGPKQEEMVHSPKPRPSSEAQRAVEEVLERIKQGKPVPRLYTGELAGMISYKLVEGRSAAEEMARDYRFWARSRNEEAEKSEQMVAADKDAEAERLDWIRFEREEGAVFAGEAERRIRCAPRPPVEMVYTYAIAFPHDPRARYDIRVRKEAQGWEVNFITSPRPRGADDPFAEPPAPEKVFHGHYGLTSPEKWASLDLRRRKLDLPCGHKHWEAPLLASRARIQLVAAGFHDADVFSDMGDRLKAEDKREVIDGRTYIISKWYLGIPGTDNKTVRWFTPLLLAYHQGWCSERDSRSIRAAGAARVGKRVWLATDGLGLLEFDPGTDTWWRYDVGLAVPSPASCRLVSERDGYVFVQVFIGQRPRMRVLQARSRRFIQLDEVEPSDIERIETATLDDLFAKWEKEGRFEEAKVAPEPRAPRIPPEDECVQETVSNYLSR